jgi:mevalonate kinase
LYLFMRLAKTSDRKSLARTFTVRSALPIGAGLGSSAAFSVCIASALLYLNGHIHLPSTSSSSPSSSSSSGSVPPPPISSSAISEETAHLVNSWAFVGEKILHGNPSGVDNSVASLGGALVFQKSRYVGEQPSMRTLNG